MSAGLSKAQIVALITIALIIGLAFFIGYKITTKKTNEITYLQYQESYPEITLKGSYLEYTELGEEYIDKGAIAKDKSGNTLEVVTTYYKNGTRLSQIPTDIAGHYLVKYTAYDQKTKNATRVVIIRDGKAPTISIPEKQTITSAEAASFDLNDGVVATDNSGQVTLTYDNTLSIVPGEYIITYEAQDLSGNKTYRKRLIKVISGIEFDYHDGVLTINFPPSPNDSHYVYKYSLDGGTTFTEGTYKTEINLNSGTVIASVYENDKYIMANSFSI